MDDKTKLQVEQWDIEKKATTIVEKNIRLRTFMVVKTQWQGGDNVIIVCCEKG